MSTPIAPKKGGLGKGLGVLLTGSQLQNSTNTNRDKPLAGGISEIPIAQIKENPFQPRTDFDMQALEALAESLRVHGLIQPITVRRMEEGRYQLISGERRWRAAKLAGLEVLPAYVRLANDQQMLEMALIENIQRENLNPIEVALSYQRLMEECSLTQESVAERVTKDRATVANYLRLLKLPPELQMALRDQRLTMGHARALINMPEPMQLEALQTIVREGLSVRATEKLAKELVASPKSSSQAPSKPTVAEGTYRTFEDRLSTILKAPVAINATKQDAGRIVISFQSAEELNRLLDLMEEM